MLFHFRWRPGANRGQYAALLCSLFQLHGLTFQAGVPRSPDQRPDFPTQSATVKTPVGRKAREPPQVSELVPVSRAAERGVSAGVLATRGSAVLRAFQTLFVRYLGVEPVVVGPGTRAACRCSTTTRARSAPTASSTPSPRTSAIAVAVWSSFGTATTFDVVTPRASTWAAPSPPGRHQRGCVISRGGQASARRSGRPRSVIGRNTVTSMQSGLVYGYVGLVDGIVERCAQRGRFFPLRVIATGGSLPHRSRQPHHRTYRRASNPHRPAHYLRARRAAVCEARLSSMSTPEVTYPRLPLVPRGIPGGWLVARLGRALFTPRRAAGASRGEPGGLSDVLWLVPLRLLTGETTTFVRDDAARAALGLLQALSIDLLGIFLGGIVISLIWGGASRDCALA